MIRALTLCLTTLALAAPAAAADRVLVCDVGGPGDPLAAAALLEKFVRFTEKQAGLTAGRLEGVYANTAKDCAAAAAKQAPALVVVDLGTWLQRRATWELVPLAHFGPLDLRRYHVIVGPDGPADAAGLAGRSMQSSLDDARFVARVVLEGKVAPEALKMKAARRPLGAVRKVKRGKLDAALVDDVTLKSAKDLGLVPPLKVVVTSRGLPGLTLGAAKGADPALVKAVAAKAGTLCQADGAEMCALLGVDTVVPPAGEAMDALQGQYDGGK